LYKHSNFYTEEKSILSDATQIAVLLQQVVCPSLRDVEVSWSHMGWNSSKIILWLVYL